MLAMSWESLESKLFEFGICVEHFSDSQTIRLSFPTPCYLISVPCSKSTPFDMKGLHGADVFYCVGREGCLRIPNVFTEPVQSKRSQRIIRRNGPFQLTFDELIGLINGAQKYRRGTSDDFYAVPASGTFMLYVSHHDQILLYFGHQRGI